VSPFETKAAVKRAAKKEAKQARRDERAAARHQTKVNTSLLRGAPRQILSAESNISGIQWGRAVGVFNFVDHSPGNREYSSCRDSRSWWYRRIGTFQAPGDQVCSRSRADLLTARGGRTVAGAGGAAADAAADRRRVRQLRAAHDGLRVRGILVLCCFTAGTWPQLIGIEYAGARGAILAVWSLTRRRQTIASCALLCCTSASSGCGWDWLCHNKPCSAHDHCSFGDAP